MSKINVGAIAVAALAALSFSGMNALAADPPSQNARDLKSNTCKDVMRLNGQDRDVSLALAHGYVLGRKGTTKYEIDRLSQITENFIDYCLENPKANALEAFEKIAK